MDYRSEAMAALTRGKVQLESEDLAGLRYAALELRFAMEALVYGRAAAMKEDFPENEYATWQPRKVMAVLLELDPNADKTRSIAMSKESTDSPNPPEFASLGTETVLTLQQIKEHYDALGSWLHMPTLAQRKSKKATDPARLRERCERLMTDIQKVLDSSLWDTVFRISSTVPCSRCRKPVRALLPPGVKLTAARCQHCNAPYQVEDVGNGETRFIAQDIEVICPNCSGRSFIWADRVKVGNSVKCCLCGHKLTIVYSLRDDSIMPLGQ